MTAPLPLGSRSDSATAGRARDLGIDAARGLALVSMFVAHFAPGGGPGGVLDLSEYLTAPLFAFLIGWGAQLGRGRHGEVVAVLVRAAALIGIGLLLERSDAQIVVVLVWLGALTLLCLVLVRLPDLALLGIAVALYVLEPRLLTSTAAALRDWRFERLMAGETADGLYPRLLELAVAGPYYRLTSMLVVACLAIVLARHAGRLVTVASLAGCALVTAGMIGAQRAGTLDMAPYTGTPAVLTFEVVLVVAVVQAVRLAATWVPAAARPLADAGRITLTAYVVQILVAHQWVQDREPGFRDDSWGLMAAMIVGSLALGWLWPRLVRWEPWSRGPVEGIERGLARGITAGVDRVRR
ncbi:putative membrane protein [Nocardioides zeae]|uniref:Membrane protein n=2 Tax=Nocardioides zeae TaxID=1457234 RepID=A0ACC6IIJ9_9ACTN|nr:heparan-alpha-glucosaminide N-acetyltransferase domain-containing protein [Nocardioides zeae]MDQ1103964.1 putative membrane protein [Nocardioides zeae]MDR6176344.1 putative membrane protein [Nocardioides zeae]MDR6210490.1 putative membrane protein [Nocardioides zeae]